MLELSKRIITILVIISFLSILFLYGNNDHYIYTLYVISIISFYEWLRLTSCSILYLVPFIILLYVIDTLIYLNIPLVLFSYIFMISVCVLLMYYHRSLLRSIIKRFSLIIGIILISLFFTIMTNFYPYDNAFPQQTILVDNKHYLIIFISLVSFIDMSAYLVGKTIGKNKINSEISPNKTYEGYYGSLALTFIAFILIANYFNFIWSMSDMILLLIFVLGAFYGDFLMSMIKREFCSKDAGVLLPGHGGILDRLDSYFTTLPIFYLWFLF